ncbi:hypothetical protein [Nitrosomonas sp.]|uniref:hypothetical protein n=1 Tax=Nitrosomonas sp. TaxID=42353 RepID=UPI0025E37D6C|nr:hypothetical protein [Nitrosomonas sp.]
METNQRKLFDLNLSEEQEQIILKNIKEFRGVGTTLESALGALIMGQYFGWRVLKILHNPLTYRRYEKILGLNFQDVCPETTGYSETKSVGYAITQKIGSFWAVVMGKRKVEDKGLIENQGEVEKHVTKHIADNAEGEKK